MLKLYDDETLFIHDVVFSRAGGVVYLKIKNKYTK